MFVISSRIILNDGSWSEWAVTEPLDTFSCKETAEEVAHDLDDDWIEHKVIPA